MQKLKFSVLGIAGLYIGLVSACVNNLPTVAESVYIEDFEGDIGQEWSTTRTGVTPAGGRQFLGPFGNKTVMLTLTGLQPHNEISLLFDLYILRSWDGNLGGGEGPDIWQLKAMDSDVLLRTTFDNHYIPEYSDHRQSYPDTFQAEHPAFTGAAETNTLGYKWNFAGVGSLPADSVYSLDFNFDHSEENLKLEFSAEGLYHLLNESWGIDNVRVELKR